MNSEPSPTARCAWLFPGQGSQIVGMGRDAYRTSPAAREVFERADAALGEHLSRLIFEGPEPELTRTTNAQPALVTASIAALVAARGDAAQGAKLAPIVAVAGHSLGEFSALVAAEALTLEDAVRLVRARGLAMDRAAAEVRGGMAAILGLEPSAVRAIVERAAGDQVLAIASHNAPGEIAVAGAWDAVERACDLAEDEGARVALLKVSAAFHCSLMAPAADLLRAELARVSLRTPTVPLIANFDGLPHTNPDELSNCLVHQVQSPVMWEDCIRRLESLGVAHAFEIGPGNVLTKLGRRITTNITFTDITALNNP